MYPDYLIHYNKNHSKANGQFTSGDGDGDGISNDHANQKKKDGGYSKTTGYQSGKKQLIRGAIKNIAADATFATTYKLSKALEGGNGSNAVTSGMRFVGGVASIALSTSGLFDMVKGGKRMASAARKYNASDLS